MSSENNTGAAVSSFVGEVRDLDLTDEPSAAEWAAMQEEAALDAFVAVEAERLAA